MGASKRVAWRGLSELSNLRYSSDLAIFQLGRLQTPHRQSLSLTETGFPCKSLGDGVKGISNT